MNSSEPIVKSIVKNCITFWMLQVLITTTGYFFFSLEFLLLFIGVSFGYHLLTTILLIVFKKDFYLVTQHKSLDSINFTNQLSLIRISSAPTLGYFILQAERTPTLYTPLIVFAALVFSTDFFDGLISRKTGQTTEIGKILDSSSDYTILFTLSTVLLIEGVLPLWFYLLLFFRLAFHAVGMIYLYISRRGIPPRSSFLGKASVFSSMAFISLRLAGLFFPRIFFPTLILVIEYLTATILVASIIDKSRILYQVSKEKAPERESSV